MIKSTLYDRTVMIIEDDPMIALEIHSVLSSVGASVLACLVKDDTKRWITHAGELSVALIDINMPDGCSDMAAQMLAVRGIPFVFYTGYDHHEMMDKWANVPVLHKPASASAIIAMLETVLKAPFKEELVRVNKNRAHKQEIGGTDLIASQG